MEQSLWLELGDFHFLFKKAYAFFNARFCVNKILICVMFSEVRYWPTIMKKMFKWLIRTIPKCLLGVAGQTFKYIDLMKRDSQFVVIMHLIFLKILINSTLKILI